MLLALTRHPAAFRFFALVLGLLYGVATVVAIFVGGLIFAPAAIALICGRVAGTRRRSGRAPSSLSVLCGRGDRGLCPSRHRSDRARRLNPSGNDVASLAREAATGT
jgi:hypothetical protein